MIYISQIKRIFLFTLLSLLFVSNIQAKGYKIDVTLNNARDSMILLAVHYGDSKFVRDTAFLDSKGKAVFENEKPLDGGMYIVAMGGSQLFDFLISDDKHQEFAIIADKDNYTQSLKFKNSPENEEFSNFNRFMVNYQKKDMELIKRITDNPNDEAIKNKTEGELTALKTELRTYTANIEKRFPNSLLLSVAKTIDKPDFPKIDVDESNPKKDSILIMGTYLATKNLFFKNYDLTDKRLLNTPIFIPTFDYYFTHIVVQTPDSIIVATDDILNKVQSNPDMLRFCAGHLFNKYMESNIMGMESVVVHLIDNYYLKGKINSSSTDTTFYKEIRQFADRNRPTLIGKKAPDLKMQTLAGQYESLYNIDSPYTLVYFYEPSCGHCQKETPKINKVYKKYKNKGLQAYAVFTRHDKAEWAEYVTKNNMDWINVWDPNNENDFRNKYNIYVVPQAYLLDKDKNIIGRRLDAEGLDMLLENLLSQKNKK